MEIKILGTGCPKCQKLEGTVKEYLNQNNLDYTITKVQNIEDILNYGVISTPALVVDEKVVLSGRIPTKDELSKILKQ